MGRGRAQTSTDNSINPRPAVQALPEVAHGALDYLELEQHRLDPQAVIDFSTNTNPYGPPPGVRAAIQGVPLDRYPDREALSLRRALAAHLGVPVDNLLAGNGSAELMWLTALAFLDPGQRVLIAGPTFGEYARAAAMMGAALDELRASEADGFVFQPERIAGRLAQAEYRLAFVCNPNNPTGQALPAAALDAWAQAFRQTLFVVDEAYIAFAEDLESAIQLERPNILVLRSMTKDYALTGLRLGYAVGDAGVIAALRKVRPPWNVNALALAAGAAALEDRGHVAESIRRLREASGRLQAALAERRLAALPSRTHYFLVRVGDASAWRSGLRRRSVLVRDCASFGLPAYARIAARRPEENARLLAAIDAVHAEEEP